MDLDDIIDRYARTPEEREHDAQARIIREALGTTEGRRKLAGAVSEAMSFYANEARGRRRHAEAQREMCGPLPHPLRW